MPRLKVNLVDFPRVAIIRIDRGSVNEQNTEIMGLSREIPALLEPALPACENPRFAITGQHTPT